MNPLSLPKSNVLTKHPPSPPHTFQLCRLGKCNDSIRGWMYFWLVCCFCFEGQICKFFTMRPATTMHTIIIQSIHNKTINIASLNAIYFQKTDFIKTDFFCLERRIALKTHLQLSYTY